MFHLWGLGLGFRGGKVRLGLALEDRRGLHADGRDGVGPVVGCEAEHIEWRHWVRRVWRHTRWVEVWLGSRGVLAATRGKDNIHRLLYSLPQTVFAGEQEKKLGWS